jgi:hypothetical protein
MRKLALLGLLACLVAQLAPQRAHAQAAAAGSKKTAAPAAPKPAEAPAPQAAPAPVAPAAPPGAFPQEAQTAPPPQVAPPPPVVGPYPYNYGGYGYAAPVNDPARQKTLADLQQVDLRLTNLHAQQQQYSLTGPSIMMGAGFAVALGFGIAAIIDRVIAEDIQHGDCRYNYNSNDYYYDDDYCDVSNNGLVTQHDEDLARTMARTFGAISIIGTGVGITGAVFLMKRLAERRQFTPELQELKVRRGQLLQQLRYGGGYSNNTFRLTLSASF